MTAVSAPLVASEPPRFRDARYPAILGTLVLVSALVSAALLYLTAYKNFYMDEWDFITGERAWNLNLILMPHNEHWVTIPVLIWKLLFVVVGIRNHIPYEAALLVVHVAAVLLLFTLIRRRSGDLPAFAAATVLLVLGTGGTNIVWAFQIGFVGSVAFGLLAMIFVDRKIPFRGQQVATSVAVLGSLMCSGIGIGFLAAVAAELATDPGRRRRLLALAAPVAILAVWFLAFSSGIPGSPGTTCPGCGPPAVGMDFAHVSIGVGYFVGVAAFVAYGLAASGDAIFGAVGVGAAVILLPVVGALIALRWHRQGRVESWQIGLVTGFVVLFTVIGLVRTRFGSTGGADPHYVYVGVVFLLPLAADAIAGLPWRMSWRSSLTVLFALSLLGNAVQLRNIALSQTDIMRIQNAELQTFEVFRGAPDMALDTSPDPVIMPQLTASRYFPAIDQLGSPVPKTTISTLQRLSPDTVDQVLRNVFGAAVTVTADSQRSVDGLSCQSVDATAGSVLLLRVPDGESFMLESSNGGSAVLFLGYLGLPAPVPVQKVKLAPVTREWVHMPDTGKPIVWQLQIDTDPMGIIQLCGSSSIQVDQLS